MLNNGYALVKNLIAADTVRDLYDYINQEAKEGRGSVDCMVAGATYFYKEPVFELLLERLRIPVERHTGQRLYKTYSYVRLYNMGDSLQGHTDREACEFTVSILLGLEGQPWPLSLIDQERNVLSFSLEPGDALIFKGVELYHWRDVNVYGKCTQLFLHYVDRKGPYASCRDDRALVVSGI